MKIRVLALFSLLSLVLVSACGSSSDSSSASYPKKGQTITYIVGQSPGGPTDNLARLIANHLQKQTGGRVEVQNIQGAGGQIGLNDLLKAKADGYTIENINLPSALKYLYPGAAANFTRKSFAPVANMGYSPNAIFVKADSKYKTLQDLIDDAKAHPGQLRTVSDGALSDDSLGYDAFEQATGTKFRIAAADGGSVKVADLLGGNVDFIQAAVSTTQPQIKSGDFRALVVLSDTKSAFLPDTPTAKDVGLNFVSDGYFGITMRAGTPKQVVDALTADLKKVSEDPEFQKGLKGFGMDSNFLGPEGLNKVWSEKEDFTKKALELSKTQ
jgi:tripartite-type tricarboxylate transporter receptor subunit TctC